MNPNAWAQAWENTLRSAISDEAVLLAGHNDLTAGGLSHLSLTPGRATATVTARHDTAAARPTITLPVLTPDRLRTVLAAAPHCDHEKALQAGKLPECLADPTHTANLPLVPTSAEIGFTCSCAASPCRHAAALAHAVTHRLTSHPADFALLRGASPPAQKPATTASATKTAVSTARCSPSGRIHLPAHHAWAWYRECAELPLVPEDTSSMRHDAIPTAPSWTAPPPPAPRNDQLNALLTDASEQARSYLYDGTPLECSMEDDAARLSCVLPGIRMPEVAERVGVDIAEWRERVADRRSTVRAVVNEDMPLEEGS